MVHAAVRADIPLARFCDQNTLRAEHPHALIEDHLDHPRVGFCNQVGRKANRLVACDDVVEIADAPFCF